MCAHGMHRHIMHLQLLLSPLLPCRQICANLVMYSSKLMIYEAAISALSLGDNSVIKASVMMKLYKIQ